MTSQKMVPGKFSLVAVILFSACFCQVAAQTSWTITQTLDSAGKYNLTRWVNMEESDIVFEVSVETTGFVGFGLSYTGGMAGADIVIGGVYPDSTLYFSDRHATGSTEPIIDDSKDWFLLAADEKDGVTTIKFHRKFDTCDKNDIAITGDTLKMIWSYGPTDTIEYHRTNRGMVSVNLLDPPQPNPDLSDLKEWSVIVDDTMPTQETTYMCTIHTTPPEITTKTFLVGFAAQLDGIVAETHTHHFILTKCVIEDEEAREILESNLGKRGRDCSIDAANNPRRHCTLNMFVWAKGGEVTMFPENVGFPILENSEKEYYMLEIHYDNPQQLADVKFNTGIKIYYDDKRTIEAGLFVVGHQVWFPHTIPPNSQNFMTLGHCPSECTKKAFPETGINVFNVLLHSHLSGRRLKVRHIRDGKELPWISNDDNYDFNYQQNRPLRQQLVILPGDHLMYECITDTTWKNGKLTIGDLATSDEMCETFMFYYPRVSMDLCVSTVDTDVTIFDLLGVQNMTDNPDNDNNPIITAPESMAGMTYIDALETVVNWTPQLRSEFQQAVRYGDQHFICGHSSGVDLLIGNVSYPSLESEYQPIDTCTSEPETTTEKEPGYTWKITQTLDSAGKYNLTRWVNMDQNNIVFEVSVETTGFVGFGLSYTGGMAGADIVIGGVNNDNSLYFTDRHATAPTVPVVDGSQDWFLLAADERDGITTIKFHRKFDTCDDDDIPITDDTLKMIWSYGTTDTIEYHGTNRGMVSVNLLDPPQPNPDLSDLNEWHMIVDDTMPTEETTYMCTVHTTPPELTSKTFLVGFEAQLDGSAAETHTHHFILTKCVIEDEEARQILERNLGKPGQDCNNFEAPDNPRRHCTLNMFVWAKGGEVTMFPENVGFPILETSEKEYYMLEIHYDNPHRLADVKFNTGIKIYYDDKRTIEAGLFVVGHQVWFPHTIPPNSQNFMTLGHCPSECTKKAFPETGINVFNVLLHSHLSGRRLKVRHIRDGKELPWISNDDNYDFNYQQNRPLRQERVILPGDHLMYECITDTTWKNGKLTIGDLATSDEMCETFMFYYPRGSMDACLSTVNTDVTVFELLGVRNMTDNPANNNNPIITAPESMAGMTYIDALEKVVNWTPQLRSEFQQAVRYGDHSFVCGDTSGIDILIGNVSYPSLESEYQPIDTCNPEPETTTEKEPEYTWKITQTLDSAGKYNLTRWVNMAESNIVFEVSVETTGFVGFGLSYTGGMSGADIVIGGVQPDSTTYFTDRHATGPATPIIDASQDWFLLAADENDGVTTVKFHRKFDTCDGDDIPITEDTLKMIWSYGPTDYPEYHGTNRGMVSVNLLDPPQPNPDLSGLKEWHVIVDDTMPTQETTYMCTIHTTPPEISSKTFLVGFEAQLEGSLAAETHTHHFIFSACFTQDDTAREILEDHLGKPGWECNSDSQIRNYCTQYMFVWAKGGLVTMFPEKVGFPIAESSQKEYYMLEIHYDNPMNIPGIKFNTGINIYYEDKREIEAGLLVVGHEVWYPHTIPPNSKGFMTLGHCSSECTKWGFPEAGINVFNVLLHAHLSGRRLRIRHFRDDVELPWINNDDNYDFNYQQNRPLREELVILPGDHLMYECITDTTWKNGKLTIGDLATSDEMCETFLFYYPRMKMDNCISSVDPEITLFEILGIKNVTENPKEWNNPIITAPDFMAGLTYIEALETKVDWTPELRNKFQETVKFRDQPFYCGKAGSSQDELLFGTVKYPHVSKEYQPENVCVIEESTTENLPSTNGDSETTGKEIEESTTENLPSTNGESETTGKESKSTTDKAEIPNSTENASSKLLAMESVLFAFSSSVIILYFS